MQQRRPPTLPGRGSLLVELFGPAACGKTTLAQALERVLKARGVPVHLVASSRPAEAVKAHRGVAGISAPLSRASKLFSAMGALGPTEPLVGQLMDTLPPNGWIRALRFRRYLRNLCRSWDAALASQDVVIFDQGFMNSLCSLALSSGSADRNSLERGLSLLRMPDLLIRLDTPREVLESRLEGRRRRQTTIERWFERDIETALRQFELSSCLDQLLAGRGRRSLHVSWRDGGLTMAVETIADEITKLRKGGSA